MVQLRVGCGGPRLPADLVPGADVVRVGARLVERPPQRPRTAELPLGDARLGGRLVTQVCRRVVVDEPGVARPDDEMRVGREVLTLLAAVPAGQGVAEV